MNLVSWEVQGDPSFRKECTYTIPRGSRLELSGDTKSAKEKICDVGIGRQSLPSMVRYNFIKLVSLVRPP